MSAGYQNKKKIQSSTRKVITNSSAQQVYQRIDNQRNHQYKSNGYQHGEGEEPLVSSLIKPRFGFALMPQIRLMESCISPKIPDAASNNITAPMAVANKLS